MTSWEQSVCPGFNPNLISHRFPANFPRNPSPSLDPSVLRGRPRLPFPPSWHTTSHLSETQFWGTEIWGTSPPRLLNFVQQRLIFIGFRYGTCYTSQFWRLEFLGDSYIFGKFVDHHWQLITYIWEQTRSGVVKPRAAGCIWHAVLFYPARNDAFELISHFL